MKTYLVLAKELFTDNYIAEEIETSNEIQAKRDFFRMYSNNYFEIISVNQKLNAKENSVNIGEYVEIVCVKVIDGNDVDVLEEFLNKKGHIIDISPEDEFPIEIDFDNKTLNEKGLLWKPIHIRGV